MSSTTSSSESTVRAVPDRMLGAGAVVMIAVAAYLLLFGGLVGSDDATGSPPALEFAEPAIVVRESGTLLARFQTAQPISLQPGGWGTDGFHIHARIDESELMPAATDIRRAEARVFEWALPVSPTDVDSVTLYWSDETHRPIPTTERVWRRPTP